MSSWWKNPAVHWLLEHMHAGTANNLIQAIHNYFIIFYNYYHNYSAWPVLSNVLVIFWALEYYRVVCPMMFVWGQGRGELHYCIMMMVEWKKNHSITEHLCEMEGQTWKCLGATPCHYDQAKDTVQGSVVPQINFLGLCKQFQGFPCKTINQWCACDIFNIKIRQGGEAVF